MKFVIVTGMSGAGKRTAMKLLEDIGFYCVDNLPVQLVTMMQGAILFFVLGGEIFTRYKLIVIRKEGHSYAK